VATRAAPGLGLAALLHAQLQRAELHHAQGAFDTEQQLIVEPVQVVEVVGVADEVSSTRHSSIK